MREYLSSGFAFVVSLSIVHFFIVPPSDVLAQGGLAPEMTENKNIDNVSHDWPGFLGARRDGRSDETGIVKDWTGGNLKMLWRRKLGTGYSLGSTSGGKYYQIDAIENECRLFCLDERTGRELWVFKYEFEYKDTYGFDDGPRSSPLISDGRVYIFGVEGKLHCLDAQSGKLVWKVDTQKRFGVLQNFFGVGSTPIVSGESLIVMVGGSPEADQGKGNRLDEVGSNSSGIVIFDKRTGKVQHELVNDLASYASVKLYNDSGTTRAVAWMRENLVGIDIENGKQLWSYPFRARKYESVNASTPVVHGTQILISESYGPGSVLLDVKENKPQVIWKDKNIRNRSLATHWNTPVFHQGHVYACNGESRADVRCVEWKTGKVKWSQKGFSRSSLTYVDGHFVLLDETGELALLKANSEKYELVSEYSSADGKKLSLKRPCWAAPVISNGLLFVRGKDELVCLELIP